MATTPESLESARPRSLAIVEVSLAVIFWGGSFVATKIALQALPPSALVWLRFGIGLVLLGATVLQRRQLAWPGWREAAYFAWLGFLGIAFHQWLQATGLVTAQATTTAWIVATTPIFMALLGWLVLKERLSVLAVVGIALAAGGVLLVASRGNPATLMAGKALGPGDWLVVISAANWAVFSAFSRRSLRRYPAALAIFYVMLFGWLFTTPGFLLDGGPQLFAALTTEGWWAAAFLGIACSGLAYIFWYDALQVLPVTQAGAFVYFEPFVTVIMAAILLSEEINAVTLVGGGAIIMGVWLVSRPVKKLGG